MYEVVDLFVYNFDIVLIQLRLKIINFTVLHLFLFLFCEVLHLFL
jgi:hypothetical protein